MSDALKNADESSLLGSEFLTVSVATAPWNDGAPVFLQHGGSRRYPDCSRQGDWARFLGG